MVAASKKRSIKSGCILSKRDLSSYKVAWSQSFSKNRQFRRLAEFTGSLCVSNTEIESARQDGDRSTSKMAGGTGNLELL